MNFSRVGLLIVALLLTSMIVTIQGKKLWSSLERRVQR